MLETLHRIVHDVNSASNLGDALQLIVKGVKEAITANVCSVYLTEPVSRSQVLMATDGLRQDAVGKVTLPQGRGLVGLVAERAEPINLDNAPEHPRYMQITETGETSYHGFLGVPIIQNRQVLGVLVVRQEVPREFNDEEVTFIFTLAAQLAGAITHARATGELEDMETANDGGGNFLSGRGSSTGVGVGTAVVAYRLADLDAIPDRQISDTEQEVHDFLTAVSAVEADLRALQGRMHSQLLEEDRALFDALLLMLRGDSLIDQTVDQIEKGYWAPSALRQTIQAHAKIFEAMEDVYLRERASDIRDLGRRILTHLQKELEQPVDYPERTILVGDEVSAVQLAEVPHERLVAVASAAGSSSSHVAILARAMGVPAVMGVTDMPVNRLYGRQVIVDGYRGRVYTNPTPSVIDEYERLAEEEREISNELEALRGLPAETTDGHKVPLMLNTGLVNELTSRGAGEAEGIGLYRTELPFMIRDRFPSEAEQVNNYTRVIAEYAPNPVILRTLDIGGDKPLPYFPVQEQNPFLGWRGVRISLDHPEIFLTQIRAMLRASIGFSNLRIMLPMISGVTEVDELLMLIQQSYDELIEEGEKISMPKVGVMVEVPSAVYQAEELARRVDFLSIGTNDLTQYLLAVDRNNPSVATLYDELHPAVLRAISQIVEGGHSYNRSVSVCGEMAGNPLATILLVGMGVDSFSMSAGSLMRVKAVTRNISRSKARQLAKAALRMEDPEQVHRFMERCLDDLGLGGFYRPGR